MDYTTLITNQWQNSPKFLALVSVLTACIDANTQIVNSLPLLFDVDYAVGDQLDKTGQWIGISRELMEPITGIFFSWDTVGLGWDQGYWQGPEIVYGLTSIPDPEYRAVLKAQIALNTWDGDINNAIKDLQLALPNNGFVITDNQDMTMTISITGTVSPLLTALVGLGYFTVRPAGVLMTAFTSQTYFGWDTETSAISGWDVGYWGGNAHLLT